MAVVAAVAAAAAGRRPTGSWHRAAFNVLQLQHQLCLPQAQYHGLPAAQLGTGHWPAAAAAGVAARSLSGGRWAAQLQPGSGCRLQQQLQQSWWQQQQQQQQQPLPPLSLRQLYSSEAGADGGSGSGKSAPAHPQRQRRRLQAAAAALQAAGWSWREVINIPNALSMLRLLSGPVIASWILDGQASLRHADEADSHACKYLCHMAEQQHAAEL